jgi:putative transposase
MSKIYKTSSHLTYSCQYHVIFCPKYRRSVLINDIVPRLKELFIEISEKYDFTIIEMEVMPDHVHLLIDCNPRFGIMEVVHKLKGITSNILREEFPELKRKLPSLWTRSAFISTVGSVSLDVVKQYIQDQKGK